MAAMSIAFDLPDSASAAQPARHRPVDLVHLAIQTMGDKALEMEILALFTRQARLALHEIGHLDDAGVAASAHRLKSAANAVGAFEVAGQAERLEATPQDPALRAAVGACVIEAENFILKLLR